MPARTAQFEKDIQLDTTSIPRELINAELARFARQELALHIERGEASPIYDRFVNGRAGAEEETVEAPGPILYVFSWWQEIIEFALDYLRRRSPVLSGRYQESHSVMLGSQFITPGTPISADETVTIVNTQPYSRKIEVGYMQMSVPRGVYEDAKREVQRKFPFVRVVSTQILIPNGYILKGVFRQGFRQYARTGLKKDTMAGARMTYPAIQMSLR